MDRTGDCGHFGCENPENSLIGMNNHGSLGKAAFLAVPPSKKGLK
jgi:hypothetical protein